MADELIKTVPLPKWLQYRYALLWKAYGASPFTQEQAGEALGELKQTVRVILSELRHAGWLNVELDKTDIRKFNYILRPPEQVYREIGQKEVVIKCST